MRPTAPPSAVPLRLSGALAVTAPGALACVARRSGGGFALGGAVKG
ncbi:hypothetical protein [Streptomyces sp. HM190]|nr:hypothetical protein [Streptomyces sp. HM190]